MKNLFGEEIVPFPVGRFAFAATEHDWFAYHLREIEKNIQRRTDQAVHHLGRAVATIVEIVADNGVITNLYISRPVTSWNCREY